MVPAIYITRKTLLFNASINWIKGWHFTYTGGISNSRSATPLCVALSFRMERSGMRPEEVPVMPESPRLARGFRYPPIVWAGMTQMRAIIKMHLNSTTAQDKHKMTILSIHAHSGRILLDMQLRKENIICGVVPTRFLLNDTPRLLSLKRFTVSVQVY